MYFISAESCHGKHNEETKDEYFIVNLFEVNSILFVIYYCMTNRLKMQQFKKTNVYHIVVSVCRKSRCSLAGSSGSLSLIDFNQGIGWSCRHLNGGLRKDPLVSSLMWLEMSGFLFLFSTWASPLGNANMEAGFPKSK